MADSTFQKVTARSLVDAVTEQLEVAIMEGRLAPGDRISEQKLAQSLGVSRGPLREAIRRLEGRRLVEYKANIGVRVAELSEKRLEDLLIVREAMEGMGARLACSRMSDQQLDDLESLIEGHSDQVLVQGSKGYYQESGDRDFHFRIAKASENNLLVSLVCGDLYDLLRIYRYKSSTMVGRAEAALEEHRAILRALRQRDPEKAEAAMRNHLRNARKHALLAMGGKVDPPKQEGSEDIAN